MGWAGICDGLKVVGVQIYTFVHEHLILRVPEVNQFYFCIDVVFAEIEEKGLLLESGWMMDQDLQHLGIGVNIED